MINKCILCNKEFETKVSNKKICNDNHYKTCIVCGNRFKLKLVSETGRKERPWRLIKRDFCYNQECIKEANELKKVQTNQRKYGVDYPFQSKEIQDKVKETFDEKYNGNPFKDKHVKDKIKKTWIEKYGTNHPMKNKKVANRAQSIQKSKNGGQLAFNTERQRKTMIERYGVAYLFQNKTFRERIFKNNIKAISKRNTRLANLLNKYNIRSEFEFCIKGKPYDIHILNSNILIEIDPTYNHNNSNKYQIGGIIKNPKDKYYHYNKTKLALDNNYICIHKFDW